LRCTDLRQEIKNSIAYWTKFAESRVEPNPATDGTLDRTAVAKAVLATLQRFNHTLAAAERNTPSRDLFYLAICYSLSLADDVYQLAIIDNETPIAARQKSIEGGHRRGSDRSASVKDRDLKMAEEFLKRQGKGKRDTALKVKIGADFDLQSRASINAVNRGLMRLAAQSHTPSREPNEFERG